MPFEVTFDDQPYPLPPELLPPPLGLLPGDQSPDKLALTEALSRLQRDVTRLSGRLQVAVQSQEQARQQLGESLAELESRLERQIATRPVTVAGGGSVAGGGLSMEQLAPALNRLAEQLTAIQRKVNPLSEELGGVKEAYKAKVEEGLIERILPALDSFERLFDSARQVDDPKVQKWLEGVAMIQNQLRTMLRGLGVEEIEALGQPFDPKIYAAVGTVPTNDAAPNTIVRVGRTGFRRVTERGTQVLRVPEVFVARPAEEEQRLGESQMTRQELLARQKAEAEAEAAAKAQQAEPPTPEPVEPAADIPSAAEPGQVSLAEPDPDPATFEIGPGEDKFAEIRAKAQAALEGLAVPEAHLEPASPVPAAGPPEPSPPKPAPPAADGWGNIGPEAAMPADNPALPEIEGGAPQQGPPVDAPALEGGGSEFYSNGDAVYELRMELGLTLVDFWGHAFGKGLGDQQLMDLGEAVEREEESIDEKELRKLARGLGMEESELRARFREG